MFSRFWMVADRRRSKEGKEAGDLVKKHAEDIKERMHGAGEQVKDKATAATERMQKRARDAGESVKEHAEDTKERAQGAGEQLKEKARDTSEEAKQSLRESTRR
ncbi:MAG: hypothetical protein ABSC94_24200 [Polyangiaceae bacterium]